MTNPPIAANIARRLKSHDRWCKIHTWEHYCSCGRDEALDELDELLAHVSRSLISQDGNERDVPAPSATLTVRELSRRLSLPKEPTK